MREVVGRSWWVGVLSVSLAWAGCGGSSQAPNAPSAPDPKPESAEAGDVPRLSEAAVAEVDSLLSRLDGDGTAKPASTPAGSPSSVSEWMPGKNMSDTLDQVLVGAQRIVDETSFGYEGENVVLLGAFLMPGEAVHTRRHLQAGVHYAFVASSARSTSIGYVVRDPSNSPIRTIPTQTGEAVVDFTPTVSGMYQLSVVAMDDAQATFVTIAALREGGVTIPADRFRTSVHGTIGRAAHVSKGVIERGIGSTLRFHAEGDWALYGMVMPPGGSMDISNIRFAGTHIILSSGDQDSRDINLALLDPAGRVVERDADPGAIAMLGYQARTPGALNLKVDCAQASGRSLVTALVLTVD
ncbi:MAG: hypothetical protein KIT72_18090 [Polyangiaceae bacterium]|nr:hypothetical protein [Polyangiaceae bacterium]MCW5792327.1 hypothetical protein [Polyangiaceae bacterium]